MNEWEKHRGSGGIKMATVFQLKFIFVIYSLANFLRSSNNMDLIFRFE
jgi:hypothetical protein